jgi:acyl dehydratase
MLDGRFRDVFIAAAVRVAAMATVQIEGIEGLKALRGKTIGPSEWRELTQEDINTYADLTGDHQWIHVDVERARRESPFGTTIAHGNLTLSLIEGMRLQLLSSTGLKLGVNYGWNKVRFPAPVPVGSRLRARAEVLSVDDVGGGWYQIVTKFTVEIEGGDKPVCVAESVGRALPED